jgi:putative aldouronate transport system substrate-binding protein
MTDIQTYCDEMMMKFIMGIEPMSNFDQFVAQMEQMGIADAIEVQQAALDRYLSK